MFWGHIIGFLMYVVYKILSQNPVNPSWYCIVEGDSYKWIGIFIRCIVSMLFSFKQKSQDFIVEEVLPFALSGKGDAFFVYFEKRNMTTMDIIDFLGKELGLSRMSLGFAGLKDKDAITRQWVSIYQSALKKIWGEKVFLETLAQKTRIISTDRHDAPIGMTTPIQNTFYIRLRALKTLSQEEKIRTETCITTLFTDGFPNLFGNQRFGIQYQNIALAKQLLEGTLKIKEKFEIKFKLQSYASWLFNEYVLARTKKWLTLYDGEIVEVEQGNTFVLWYFDEKTKQIQLFEDIRSDKDFFHYSHRNLNNSYSALRDKNDVKISFGDFRRLILPSRLGKQLPLTDDLAIHITGPVLGFDLLLPLADRQAGKKEQHLFDSHWLSPKKLQLYKHIGIYGIRRRMRTRAKKAKFHFDRDDVCIQFTLDSGVYASIFIEKLLKSLG